MSEKTMRRLAARTSRREDAKHLYCMDCGKRNRLASTYCHKCGCDRLSVRPLRVMAPKAAKGHRHAGTDD